MDKKPIQEQNERLSSQPPDKQLIPEKGEEYLREAGNIEDMPNPEEDEEAVKKEGEPKR